MVRKTVGRILVACAFTACAGHAFAWGNTGHEAIATEAFRILARESPETLVKVKAILQTETDAAWHDKDDAEFATWADWYRDHAAGAREATGEWHYVDIDYDAPDENAACFNHPGLNGQPASAGPAHDCVADKIAEFAAELKNPATSGEERLAALKFLLHFTGDIHQPLHAATHLETAKGRDDRGGNCVGLAIKDLRDPVRLHSYWDTRVVEKVLHLTTDPEVVARALDPLITPENEQMWRGGTPDDWAKESFDVAKNAAYAGVIDQSPTEENYVFKGYDGKPDDKCGPSFVYPLTEDYEANAKKVAGEQLAKASVRLAALLEDSLK